MKTVTAFPLSWPKQFPRTKYTEKGRFSSTLVSAINNVKKSLDLFALNSGRKLQDLVVSSNVTLGVNRPQDPGVSVWFTWDEMQVCIPVDRYNTVESNLQAIHHIIEARRVELRHGTLALVRATFHGFLALPQPANSEWWGVLGISKNSTGEQITSAYRRLASKYHPDKPHGSNEKMTQINDALTQAELYLGQ